MSSEQSICFLPALGTVPLSSSMVYVTVILQPLLSHYSFLLSADIPHSPPSSYSSLAPLLLHHLILNIRNPLPPYNPGTWAFTLLHRAPGTLSAFRLGSGKPLAAERSSAFQETAFLPFMLADGMICRGKMESPMEECGKNGCTSTPGCQ